MWQDSTSVADQSRVLRAIRRAGIQDAFAMPDDPEFRVSVGIFSERVRAEDRARRVAAAETRCPGHRADAGRDRAVARHSGRRAATLADGRLAAAGIDLEGLTLEVCPSSKPPG